MEIKLELNNKIKTRKLLKEIRNEIQRWKTERILLVFIDSNGNIFNKQIVSIGYHKYSAYYYPAAVIKLIKELKPTACVWSHNHVNDYCEPSDEDDNVHKWFVKTCNDIGVIPYDSIIIMKNSNDYYSYRKHNRLFIS